jgi:hypothetical protein
VQLLLRKGDGEGRREEGGRGKKWEKKKQAKVETHFWPRPVLCVYLPLLDWLAHTLSIIVFYFLSLPGISSMLI